MKGYIIWARLNEELTPQFFGGMNRADALNQLFAAYAREQQLTDLDEEITTAIENFCIVQEEELPLEEIVKLVEQQAIKMLYALSAMDE